MGSEHWKHLLSWVFSPHVFEVGAFFCAAVGVSMALAPDREDIARAHWFFGVAFAFLAGRAIQWLIGEQLPYPKPIVAAVVFAIVGASWMIVYQWVQNKLPA